MSEQREKRSVSQDQCPQNMTEEECKTWVEDKSKAKKYCHRYYLSGHSIEWQRYTTKILISLHFFFSKFLIAMII